jgi:hypothetical protein
MTIRFTCAGCGSLLKIKDDLAGTDGKCPKCKTEFVVPEPEAEEDSGDSAELLVSAEPKESNSKGKSSAEKPREPVAEKTVEKPSKPKPKKSAGADDFDPADFLMGGEAGSRRPAAPIEDLGEPEERPRRAAEESKPKRGMSKPPSSSEMATTAASGISASAHAKEMMMKAMEDSRLHAGELPPEEEKPGFDWAGFFQEYGVKWGGGLIFGLVLCYGLYLMFDSMMGSRLKLPKLGYVTGTVTLDGQPLAGATVYFAPIDATMADSKKERARTSMGVTDEKGHYTMTYLPNVQGVAIGKCRFWVDKVTPEKGQVVPAEFSEAKMQVKEIQPGTNPPFAIDMKSN